MNKKEKISLIAIGIIVLVIVPAGLFAYSYFKAKKASEKFNQDSQKKESDRNMAEAQKIADDLKSYMMLYMQNSKGKVFSNNPALQTIKQAKINDAVKRLSQLGYNIDLSTYKISSK